MRKQDNSKLIYLLIGVVSVFILVFQYKSWCSAAEFEIVEKYSDEVEETVSSIPLEEVVPDDGGVSELTSEAPTLEATSETVVQNFDDSAIVEELKKSNEYWEMFLDSYSVTERLSLPASSISYSSIYGGVISESDTKTFAYVPVSSGFVVDLDYTFTNSYASLFYCYFVDSLDFGTRGQLVFSSSDLATSFNPHITYTVPSDGFLCFSIRYSNSWEPSINLFYFYTHFDSYTLSELGNAVIQNGTNVSEILVYVLITCCFVCCYITLRISWYTRSQIRKWSGRDSH